MILTKRIDELDVLKGIGILLMILDHCFGWGQRIFPHSVIQSFHMPLFFIISGYLWKKKDRFRDFAKHKAETLLLPYYNFCLIYSMVFLGLLLLGKTTWEGTAKSIMALLIFPTRSDLTVFASPIWFLLALYLVEVLFTSIKMKTGKYFDSIIITIGVLGIVYSEIFNYILPFALEPVSTGIIFFYIGYKLNKCRTTWFKFKNLWVLILMIFLWIGLVAMNGCVDMRSARYYNPILYIINGVLGTLIVWNISRIINSHLKNIATVIKHFSICSITYLCTHYIFVYYGNRMLSKLLPLSNDLIRIILFVCVLMICWIINRLIMKYTPWIIGKKKFVASHVTGREM